ncbi:MAG: 1-deoxy-D-xylulose 5-phosphate reductoisomerase [Chlamydiia bacterium]|nr:1-deoxy-D-xylulose 5-phosphate reductoisomerase [Chlamydiia bacterium]
MKKVAVFGSTGCVGRKTLDVIRQFKDRFEVQALSCYQNVALLKKQVEEFSPKVVSVNADSEFEFSEKSTVEEIAKDDSIDIFVFAMEGISGIKAAFTAAKNKKRIVIANKEILVCAGESFMKLCRQTGAKVYSIDHEQSAIDQCLRGEDKQEVSQLILTASGGPFFNRKDFSEISYKEASHHPTHSCGKKIAVNSSTLMNKGLEMIESKHFFGIDNIDVVIHPQSVVQSFVMFNDGVMKALFSTGDLSHSIQYALLDKKRLNGGFKPFSFNGKLKLEFYPKDESRFRCLFLASNAMKEGGSKPSYLNGANEVLVERFCKGELSWNAIGETLDKLMNQSLWKEASLEAVLEADKKARMDAWGAKLR